MDIRKPALPASTITNATARHFPDGGVRRLRWTCQAGWAVPNQGSSGSLNSRLFRQSEPVNKCPSETGSASRCPLTALHMRPLLRFRAPALAPPHYSVNRWRRPQVVGQVEEGDHVLRVGAALCLPSNSTRCVGSVPRRREISAHDRSGLLLETAPGDAGSRRGKVVCSSAVVSALSRHRRQSLSRTGRNPPPRRDVQAASRGVRKQNPISPPPQDLGRTQAGRGPLFSPGIPHMRAFLVAWKAKRRPPTWPSRPARQR